MSIIVTTPKLNVNGNIAHSNVNNIIGVIKGGRANEFASDKDSNTLLTKANKVITRVDVNGNTVVMSTVAVNDNEDNSRTYTVTVKVSGNDEATATSNGTVTVPAK